MPAHGPSRPPPSVRDASFVPAAGVDWLLPLYDPLCRLLGAHRHRERLLDAAAIRPGDRVLDLGCGTGALSLQVKRRHPDARVTGLDPDAKALERSRAKAARAGVAVEWRQGFGDALPFPDASFERVVSSLVLHHLTHDGRRATLAEVARVLAPSGTIHVLDFGPPHGTLDRLLLHAFHRDDRLEDNLAGRIPALMAGAGLADAREVAQVRSLFGSLSIWRATK
ncbi:MAG TPA: methyltransferase domain-containing protein [Myxococcota bacterium]|nr:methyltransferase domain-containing protein [Myxococcota bacterium]